MKRKREFYSSFLFLICLSTLSPYNSIVISQAIVTQADAFHIIQTITDSHPNDLPLILQNNASVRMDYSKAHLILTTFQTSTQLQDTFTFYKNLLNSYPQYFIRNIIYDKESESTMAWIRERIYQTFINAMPLTIDRKDEISTATKLTGRYFDIWNDFSVFLLDNANLDGQQKDFIYNLLSLITKDLHNLRSISIIDYFGQRPPEFSEWGSLWNPWIINAINIFGTQIGSSPGNEFPDEVTPKYSCLLCGTLVHEVNHIVDGYYISSDQNLRYRKDDLIEQASSNHMNYLRSMLPDGFFVSAPQEFFASISNQWFCDSSLTFKLALMRFDKGYKDPLNQFLFFAEVYSMKGNFTSFYTIDTQGNIHRRKVPVLRDINGRITTIIDNGITYDFTLDEDGNVISYAETKLLGVNGRIVFSRGEWRKNQIYVMNVNESGVAQLTFNNGDNCFPHWSPDGTKIAFSSNITGNYEIYVINDDGSGLTRLTNGLANNWEPSWSPDGKKLAFTSDQDGSSSSFISGEWVNREIWEIYTMNDDGTGVIRLTTNEACDSGVDWSPDGSKIAFQSGRDGNVEIYVMNADGTEQTRLTYSSGCDGGPHWSPDGLKIAFVSGRDYDWPAEIYVMNADGTEQTRLTYNTLWDWSPCWSPDGKRIAFSSDQTGNPEIFIMNIDGSNEIQLTNDPAWDWQPDWHSLVPFELKANEWPTYRHDLERTGSTVESAFQTGRNLLFVPTKDGLCALDENTGTILWRDDEIDWVKDIIAYADETSPKLFVIKAGDVYVLEPSSGTSLGLMRYGDAVAMLTYDDALYILRSSSKSIVAIDLRPEREANISWSRSFFSSILSTYDDAAASYAVTICNDNIYVLTEGLVLDILDHISGNTVRSQKLNIEIEGSLLGATALSIHENGLYVVIINSTGTPETGITISNILYAFDLDSLNLLWSVKVGSPVPPAIHDDVVYVTGYMWDGFLALDAITGRTIWKSSNFASPAHSPMVYADGIIVSSFAGVHAYDIDDGKLLWTFTTGKQHVGATAPVLIGDIAFFSLNDNNTYAVNVRTGQTVWRTQVGPWPQTMIGIIAGIKSNVLTIDLISPQNLSKLSLPLSFKVRVTYDGQPVEDAYVNFHMGNGGEGIIASNILTDSSGYAEVKDWDPKWDHEVTFRWWAEAWKRGYDNGMSEKYILTYIPKQILSIEVSPIRSTVAMDQIVNFSGTVKDQYGNGVANIQVDVDDPITENCMITTTDEHGNFYYSTIAFKAGSFLFPFYINSGATACCIINVIFDVTFAAYPDLEVVNVGSQPLSSTLYINGIEQRTVIINQGEKRDFISVDVYKPEIVPGLESCIPLGIGKLCVASDGTISVYGGEFLEGIIYGKLRDTTLGGCVGVGGNLPFVVEGSGALCLGSDGISLIGSAGPSYVHATWSIELVSFTWNSLLISSKSPVSLLVTDPTGKRVGFDPNIGLLDEIDSATYTGPNTEPQQINIPQLLAGNYDVQLFGTGDGNYTVSYITKIGQSITYSKEYTGYIVKGDNLVSTLVASETPTGPIITSSSSPKIPTMLSLIISPQVVFIDVLTHSTTSVTVSGTISPAIQAFILISGNGTFGQEFRLPTTSDGTIYATITPTTTGTFTICASFIGNDQYKNSTASVNLTVVPNYNSVILLVMGLVGIVSVCSIIYFRRKPKSK